MMLKPQDLLGTISLVFHKNTYVYKGFFKPNKSYGRKYCNWAINGIKKCTAGRELIAVGDN